MADKNEKIPLALYPPATRLDPISDRYDVFDLPSFITNPGVLATNGTFLPVTLEAPKIKELITIGRTQIDVDHHLVELSVIPDEKLEEFKDILEIYREVRDGCRIPALKPSGMPPELYGKLLKNCWQDPNFVNPFKPDSDSGSGNDSSGGSGTTPPALSMTDKVQSRLPSGTGLAVAVFVPWKQTWTLKGFSRWQPAAHHCACAA